MHLWHTHGSCRWRTCRRRVNPGARQLGLIQITTTTQGTQSFDLPPNLRRKTGPDKPRKDSYSALILGNWLTKVYYDMQQVKVENINETFTPMFIA